MRITHSHSHSHPHCSLFPIPYSLFPIPCLPQFTLILSPHLPPFQASSFPSPPPSPHFGNGLRSDFQNASIPSRIRLRRWSNFSTSASISLWSPPYHSGGTSLAASQTVSAAMASSRVSHGSNDSHPVTSRYTSLR